MAGKRKVDWGSVDWSKQDVTIAAMFGVSREAVRQARPKGVVSPCYRRRTAVTAEQRIVAMDTTGMTMAEIARTAGCCAAYAQVVMSRSGKPYRKLPSGRARYDWGLFPADWRQQTDKKIAEIVGASAPCVVAQWRIRHGMGKRAS